MLLDDRDAVFRLQPLNKIAISGNAHKNFFFNIASP
jgi:hypothetical protein